MMQWLRSAMLLLPAILPVSAAAQGRVTFCCTGDGARQVCSDVLPRECYGRAYREINAQGVVVRHVEAPLTAEQRAQREAEANKAREEAARRQEQDRKNRALLATYSSEQDIDVARDRAIADIQKAIKASQDKLAELAEQRQMLDNEAEFFKKKTMPAPLRTQIRDNDAEMKAQQEAVEAKQKEIDTVRTRYGEDKLRYRELTQKKAAADGRPR
ncbi:MAG: hypothetical protein EFKGCFLK_00284 [Rhodocyclaceae bacterium]|nr:MAG: hypothetical protein F9K21_14510 [Rhodocyclaceae bacterium]MBE7423184.1 hypothetical protein [Zoogloeaceae bacterium]MBV6406737.1 hypothetical protein [Rhodocyclaceae bacterium]MCK6384599.1 hypothetical protein [Rhodocyclaceae bacterium]CAG0931017.1 hypothetical protein RHDC3_01724 [Rhodocyclaceae bacterium]